MKPIFSKQESNILKGIGILFMFFQHMFGFPDWLVGDTYYPTLTALSPYFKEPCTIAVSIFAFLSGYLYFFSGKKGLLYSLKKVLIVYLGYWIVFLPLYLLSVFTGTQEFSVGSFLIQLAGFDSTTVTFCWYVPFFLVMMLLLALYDRFLFRHPIGIVLFGFALPIFISCYINSTVANNYTALICTAVKNYFTSATIGWVLARYGVFEKIGPKLLPGEGLNNPKALHPLRRVLYSLLSVLCMCGCLVAIYFLPRISIPPFAFLGAKYVWVEIYLYPVYTPIFILSTFLLLRCLPTGKFPNVLRKLVVRFGFPSPSKDAGGLLELLRKVMALLGNHSLLMWLFSSAFFGLNKELLQPAMYWPGKAPLVYLWGVGICLLAAWLLGFPLKGLQRVLHLSSKKEA